MNIRVNMTTSIKDGTEVVFRSPVDCSQVTGLVVYYDGGSKEFAFADAHGNNVGDIDHLFAENVVVKVILDVTTGMAFVQNADTNAYLEQRFSDLEKRIDNLPQGGGGGISAETDPTVPAWAKEPQKPSYTAQEVGALPADTVIPTVPTNVSAFQNDAGYLTEHQDLSGYAKKDEIPAPVTDEHINALIDAKLAELPAVPTYTGEVEVE